ncbi:MAG TPA: nucleoside 2-deoxyribosyltransferase [Methanospirillum sp.]|nr:nucleoside 2-deoxyribosyltransferase [Methanospirillum sp.]
MYILCCPCITSPDLRAVGITDDQDHEAFKKARDRFSRFGITVRYLPCPETLFLGKDRQPATFSERLDTPEFPPLLDRLEAEVRELIATYGPPVAIVGVDASPCCGVNLNWKSPENRAIGRGAFLDRFPDIPAYDVFEASRFKVYLAAPLFSEAERTWNLKVAESLTSLAFDVYLPQETGDTSADRDSRALGDIFMDNLRALNAADVVVAVIDGADPDSGTAWEMGYAYGKGKTVITIRTDFRRVGDAEMVNLMLEEGVDGSCSSLDQLPHLLPFPIAIRSGSSSPCNKEDKCRDP